MLAINLIFQTNVCFAGYGSNKKIMAANSMVYVFAAHYITIRLLYFNS
jgi:hypothetical protein